jgi:predicted RNA-binding Zn-ribbon protein involved in translation (DUF1610 family)
VHVDEMARSCAFVEVVHVLSDQQECSGPCGFELGEGAMGGVRLDCPQCGAAEIVEAVHQLGIPREAFRAGDILDAVAFPETISSPEGGDA